MLIIAGRVIDLRTSLLTLTAATCLTLAACGGGGGGASDTPGASSSSAAPTAAALTTGKVAILLTDGPTNAFCQILASVESMDLIGPSGTTNVFTGPATIDLLKLRNYTDLFSIKAEVPVGTYTKVRLTLSDLALVQCDSAGNPEPASGWEHPHLPGNGKLDLNPRGSFDVVGGETLVIKLDMDMDKSLFLHQTGNGKWQFRPVIFCEAITPAQDKLVRVFGAASSINGTQLQLCPLRPAPSTGSGSSTPGTECLDVFTDGRTGIFDQTGKPVGLSQVANGDLLTAIGFISLYDGTDTDTRADDLRLSAAVIELGDRGTFHRLLGNVVSAPGNNDLFVFDSTPLDGNVANAIDVRLQSGTRIFAVGSTTELTSGALQPGTSGQVDGVFTDPAMSVDPLNSSLIVLQQNSTPAVSLLDAEIQTIQSDNGMATATHRFTVVNSTNLNGKCVKTDASTRYLFIKETADTSETTEIAFQDLVAGNKVDVFGTNDVTDTDCVLADAIQKYDKL